MAQGSATLCRFGGIYAIQSDVLAVDHDGVSVDHTSLADDLSNLPPAYIATGSLDLFFDENLDYARRLTAAGVPVELHSYAGAIHAFNAIPDAPLSQRFTAGLLAAAAAMTGA